MLRSYSLHLQAAFALLLTASACSSERIQGDAASMAATTMASPVPSSGAGATTSMASAGNAGAANTASQPIAAGARAMTAAMATPAGAGPVAATAGASGAGQAVAGMGGAQGALGMQPMAAGAGGMPATSGQTCAAMVAAAKEFISTLDSDALHAAALYPFERHHSFAYEPQVADRPGLPLSMMSQAQQEKALALVHAGLSEEGWKKAETVRALENLKAVTGFQVTMRDPTYYWLAIFGDPSDTGAWGWQFEGHHLALHFTMKACAVSDTPIFMGAWPSEVSANVSGGPPVGSRNLEQQEDLGRALARSIDADPSQRMQAFQEAAYRQMLPEGADKAQPMMPAGLPASSMSDMEQMQLRAIVESYANLMAPDLAVARMQRIEEHGGIQKLSFVWTGSLEPKQRHFYRIQGDTFFIEYRNDDGNHIHSVWRDFNGDWGDDLK